LLLKGHVAMARIRVLNVDDHELFREGMAAVIGSQPDMLLVSEAATGGEALRQFCAHQPDVTLMNLRLRDSSGIDAMTAIRARFPEARVILLAGFEGDGEVQRAVDAGACGYMLKTMHPREMVETIRRVYGGKKSFPAPVAAGIPAQLGGEALAGRGKSRF
jgi:DNA-binding NarL/FixJ family response regulator